MLEKQLDCQVDHLFKTSRQIIVFIRHGESEAHIGKAATHIEEVRLTSNGEKKAREIAAQFLSAPDLIIASPYLRAWETAVPTLQRFPDVPHKIWQDVQEFTYLGSLAGLCLTKQERSGMVNSYWERADPGFRDGNGESFLQFAWRARKVLDRLRQMEGFIVIFTHEQFIRVIQCLLLQWMEDTEDTPERMRRFRKMLLNDPLPYGYIDSESWQRHLLQGEYELSSTPLLAGY